MFTFGYEENELSNTPSLILTAESKEEADAALVACVKTPENWNLEIIECEECSCIIEDEEGVKTHKCEEDGFYVE